ncbi:hypothetical protein P879_01200 [Paragonimus westermani]|uniref:RRM domain-containing protein n=1 Tax=Paragonimus westermani TaxID=34504 RepID=A0A8T0DX24_9TREM|nr:hypothetical protein P879_01200 [Paragonimus westermani]
MITILLVHFCSLSIDSVIDPNFLARLQAMVDTLAQTRALQEELNQGRMEYTQPKQQPFVSTRSNGSLVVPAEDADSSSGHNMQEDTPWNHRLGSHHPIALELRTTQMFSGRPLDASSPPPGNGSVVSSTSLPSDRAPRCRVRPRMSPHADELHDPDFEVDSDRGWVLTGQRNRKIRRLDPPDGRIASSHSLQRLSGSLQNLSGSESDRENTVHSPDTTPLSSMKRQLDSSYSEQQELSDTADPKRVERRRRHMGLPTLRPNHVGILSHTIFIGHLHKQLAETRLKNLCAEVASGEVVECNFIPPRGCAFVTFASRRSAHRAVTEMDQSKMNGREIKVAWAPNRGVKCNVEYMKSYWDPDEGCTYLPLEEITKLTRPKLDELLSGHGEIDSDSVADSRLRDLILNIPLCRSSTASPVTPVSTYNQGGKSRPIRSSQYAHSSAVYSPTALPTVPAGLAVKTAVSLPAIVPPPVPLLVPLVSG